MKERLSSTFYQDWHDHLESSGKLNVYRKYKSVFEREKYVSILYVDAFRNAMAQFRMGVSQINVHMHRFCPTAQNTSCPFCKKEIETEVHFILQCPMYAQLRVMYLPRLSNVDNDINFKQLMTTSTQESIVNLSKYILFALKRRKANLSAENERGQ